MLKQTIDIFRKAQDMNDPHFEVYNYSDTKPPYVLPHRHNFYEIYFLLCEQMDYVMRDKVFHMRKGDLMLMPPGLLHYPSEAHLAKGEAYSRIVLWCNTDFFETFCAIDPDLRHMWTAVTESSSFHIRPSVGAARHLHTHFLHLLSERNNEKFASTGMIFSDLMEIFVLVNRMVYERKHIQKSSPAHNTFDTIIYYIHTHLTEELTLDTLSQHFYVSKSYISRLFREYMGIPVHQYILSLRLEGCRSAIKNGIPIAQTAQMYGFHEYSSFFRAFKKAFSVSPKEYLNNTGQGHSFTGGQAKETKTAETGASGCP